MSAETWPQPSPRAQNVPWTLLPNDALCKRLDTTTLNFAPATPRYLNGVVIYSGPESRAHQTFIEFRTFLFVSMEKGCLKGSGPLCEKHPTTPVADLAWSVAILDPKGVAGRKISRMSIYY